MVNNKAMNVCIHTCVCVLKTKFSNRVDQLQKEISPLIPMRSSLQGQKFIYNIQIEYSKWKK